MVNWCTGIRYRNGVMCRKHMDSTYDLALLRIEYGDIEQELDEWYPYPPT